MTTPTTTAPTDQPDDSRYARLLDASRELMPAAVVLSALLAVLYTMYFTASLLLPIFFAALLSTLLWPLVKGLSRFGLPAPASAGLVLAAFLALVVTAVATLSDPVQRWLHELPRLERTVDLKLGKFRQSMVAAQQAGENIEEIAKGGSGRARNTVTVEEKSLVDVALETTMLTVVQFLITLALTYFFLTQSAETRRRVVSRIPWGENRDWIDESLPALQRSITRFLQVAAGIYLTLGVITALAMYMLGMPNPVLWGVMAAVFGFMPYVGPVIVTGCIAFASLLTFDTWWAILTPPLVYAALTTLEGYFITPAILGRYLTLNPIVVFLSMLFWTWVWGIAGAFLAVPILAVLHVLYQRVPWFVTVRERTRILRPGETAGVAPAGSA